jgi:hypothetical protein
MPFAGVDAHKRYSRVVVKDETGSILCRASLRDDSVRSAGAFGLEVDLPCHEMVFRAMPQPTSLRLWNDTFWTIVQRLHCSKMAALTWSLAKMALLLERRGITAPILE